jgi:hypothetical protein
MRFSARTSSAVLACTISRRSTILTDLAAVRPRLMPNSATTLPLIGLPPEHKAVRNGFVKCFIFLFHLPGPASVIISGS